MSDSKTRTVSSKGVKRVLRLDAKGQPIFSNPINIPPDNYRPPKSADELLTRYAEGERYFSGAHLPGANFAMQSLIDVNLSDSQLEGCDFTLAHLYGANFSHSQLSRANFNSANISSVNLDGARLKWTTFYNATINSVSLDASELDGTTFSHAKIGNTDLSKAIVVTVLPSPMCSVAPDTLEATKIGLADVSDVQKRDACESLLISMGLEQENLPWRKSEGLTLFFENSATALDRFVIDGVIYSTVGHEACEVVGYEQRRQGAIVRIRGNNPADLVVVAEVLHQRIWEHPVAGRGAVALSVPVRVTDLSQTAGRIVRKELQVDTDRLSDEIIGELFTKIKELVGPDVLEMLRDQSASHIAEKDSRSVMTWGQKGARALGKTLLKKASAGLSKAIEEEIVGSE